jgi:ACR3 family arsenite efflux pump ArsB
MGQPFHAPCVSILFVAICLLIGCMTRSQFLRILGQKYIDDEFVNIDKIKSMTFIFKTMFDI